MEVASSFYQSQYRSGFTTDFPSDKELEYLLTEKFQGSPKDYTYRIQFLRAAGLSPGDSILDFGSSWGYGSWQMREAGYSVYSYEVSKPRAEYAERKLGCRVIRNPEELSGGIDCFFADHVIEHLPDPNVMWLMATEVVAPNGMVICFAPNGDPTREHSKGYHQLWGNVHPLMLTQAALDRMARNYGFRPYVFSSPYSLERILSLEEDNELSGPEIALVAFRVSEVSEREL